MTVTITVSAQFTDSNGTPATGLALADVDITLVSIRKSDANEAVIWNALDSTREVTTLGMYQKDYATADLDTNWYFAMAEYVGASVLDSNFVFGAVGEAGLDVDGRVDVGGWLGQAVTLSSNNNPDVNVDELSDDPAAAQNLEAGWDGTGVVGDNYPSTQSQADRNASLTESNRGTHTWSGNVYYVDPVNGDTHANGNRGGRNDPYLTIQDCHDNAVTDSNHDVIILVAGAAGGVTTHTVASTTTISKRYTFIRGPGRDFIWTRSGAGDTISITADGVEISGVQIGTAATGSGDGIDITGADFVRIHNCWFLDTRGDGIHVLRGSNCQFHDNHFEGTGVGGSGQGIHIVGTAGSSNDNVIHNSHFADTAGDSIRIEDGTTNDTAIHHNEIHNSSAWGINIGASSTDAQIHSNMLGNNVSGNINDGGTNTIQDNNEQWAKHSIATEARLAELDAANMPTDLSDIQARLPAALVSGRMDSDVRAVNGNTDSAAKLALSADTMEIGVAIAGTLSTTEMTTDLTEVTDDHYNGRVLIWTSGTLLRQVASITGYIGATKKLTFTTITEAPIANDTWIMV